MNVLLALYKMKNKRGYDLNYEACSFLKYWLKIIEMLGTISKYDEYDILKYS